MVSIPLSTAHESSTITQTDVNAVFLHKLFGIKADFPLFSRQFIQPMNEGIMIPAAQSKTIFSAR